MVAPRTTLVALGLLALGACGKPPAEPTTPPPSAPTPSASVSSAPVETPAPRADDTKTSEKPASKVPAGSPLDKDEGDVRTFAWNPLGDAKPVTSKRAWVPAANLMSPGDVFSFQAVRWTLVDLVSSDAKVSVYQQGDKKYAVPTALIVNAADAKAPPRGDIGRCQFGGSYVFARFDGSKGKDAMCTVRFMGKVRQEKVVGDGVWVVPTTLAPGAVVQVKLADGTAHLGDVYVVQGDNVWVDLRSFQLSGVAKDGPFYKFARSDVTVVELASKPLAKGAQVIAAGSFGQVGPFTVDEVIDGGLAYKLKGESAPTEPVDVESVGRLKK